MNEIITSRDVLQSASAHLIPIMNATTAYHVRLQALACIDKYVKLRVIVLPAHELLMPTVADIARFVPACEDLHYEAGYVSGVYLMCARTRTPGISCIARELNGCYLDTLQPIWICRVIPPLALGYAHRGSLGTVIPSVRKFITHADDATRLTAAASNDGSWHLHTARGTTVEHQHWVGDSDFESVLIKLLATYNVKYPDDFNPTINYTFFIHHGDYHPFEASTYRITLGECVHMQGVLKGSAITTLYGSEENINTITKLSPKLLSIVSKWIGQDVVASRIPGPLCHNTNMTISELWEAGNINVDNDHIIKNMQQYAGPVGGIPYGCIVHGQNSAVLIEGAILSAIREIAYERIALDDEIKPGERLFLHALHAFMHGRSCMWKRFFIQKPYLDFINEVFTHVANNIVSAINSLPIRNSLEIVKNKTIRPPLQCETNIEWSVIHLYSYFIKTIISNQTLYKLFSGPGGDIRCKSWLTGDGHFDVTARHLIPSLIPQSQRMNNIVTYL